MDWAWVAGGLLLVCVALGDAIWTTLWPQGRGAPLSSAAGDVASWPLRRLAPDGRRRALLSAAGPLSLGLTVLLWISLLAAGWVLVFTPDEALRSTRDEDVDVAGRIWFVAYTMFTVGNGDYTPPSDWAEVAASFVAFTGLGLVTLSITYLLSVVQAVAARRAFASSVEALGGDAAEIVVRAWDGRGFGGLSPLLAGLASQLSSIQHQRRAFPMAQYFHARERSQSTEVMAAGLDDALTLWEHGVAAPARPRPAPIRAVRASIDGYLGVITTGSLPKEPPDPPDLEPLRRAGIPTVADEDLAAAVAEQSQRRRALLSAVRGDGWQGV